MYIVIIGCGRLGSTLARELSDEGHDIAIIDRDSERLNVLGSGFNGQRINGIEFDNDHLIEAGIEKADVFLAMTPDDNINITGALIAKKIYRIPRIIARVCYPNRKYIYEKLEIETISPTRLGAQILKSRIITNSLDVIASLDRDYEIIEVPVLKEKTSTVGEIENKYSCIISGILKDGNIKLPEKNQHILHGDKIICTINKKDRDRLISSLMKGMLK
ncbi:MAG: hypothetical protein A2Y21_02745 [Clostridiales bacterium GWC2_40_7]|nr:MAG: hypothetical protein A2Y21_02745 [Clostridiales bacterium GWC2_40_7]